MEKEGGTNDETKIKERLNAEIQHERTGKSGVSSLSMDFVIEQLPDQNPSSNNRQFLEELMPYFKSVRVQEDSDELYVNTFEISLQQATLIDHNISFLSEDLKKVTVFEKNRFFLLEEMGMGGSGEVKKAWDKKRAKYVAIKMFDSVKEAQKELTNFRKLPMKSKNFLSLRNVQRNEECNKIFLIIEYGICDLNNLLNERFNKWKSLSESERATEGKKIFYSEKEILSIIQDVLESLLDLYKVNIKHNDIKEKNIVYCGSRSRYFPIDFNICNPINERCSSGTDGYLNERVPLNKRDVWSLGVTIFNLIAFNVEKPKIILNLTENYDNVAKAFLKNPNEYSTEFKQLLDCMLNIEKIPLLEDLQITTKTLLINLRNNRNDIIVPELYNLKKTKKDEYWARRAEFTKIKKFLMAYQGGEFDDGLNAFKRNCEDLFDYRMCIELTKHHIEKLKQSDNFENVQKIYTNALVDLARFSVLSSVDTVNTVNIIELKENLEPLSRLASSDITKFALFSRYKGQLLQRLMRYKEAELEYFRGARLLVTQKFEPDSMLPQQETLKETLDLVKKFISLPNTLENKHSITNDLFEVLLELGNLKFELCDYPESKNIYEVCENLILNKNSLDEEKNKNEIEQNKIRLQLIFAKNILVNLNTYNLPDSELLEYVEKIKVSLKENYRGNQLNRLKIQDFNPRKAYDFLIIGIIQDALGGYKEALSAYRLYMRVLTTLNTSKYNPDLILANLYKANLLMKTGYYHLAFPELKKAMNDCKSYLLTLKIPGGNNNHENNLIMAECLVSATYLYMKLELLEKAEKFLERAESVYKSILLQYGSDIENPSILQEKIANFFIFAAEFYLTKVNNEKFESYQKKANKIIDSIGKSGDKLLENLPIILQSKMHYLNSNYHINSERYQEATNCIKLGKDFLEAVRGKTISTDLLKLFINESKCNIKTYENNSLKKMDDLYFDKSSSSIDIALKSHRIIFPENHPDILKLQLMKADLQMKKNPEEAANIFNGYITKSTLLLSQIIKGSDWKYHSLVINAKKVEAEVIQYNSGKIDYEEKKKPESEYKEEKDK